MKSDQTGRPNILFITSDQQHWNTLGCRNPEIQTPHLDRLAARGTLFKRAYCPNPTCTPTRSSIITGQYPSQHGAWSLGTKLPETAVTVGRILSDAGYETALIGKAHFQPLRSTEDYPSLEAYPVLQDLDFWRGFHGPFYGFDHVELARNHADEAHVGQHYALWMESKGCTDWRKYYQPPTGTTPAQRHHWNIPEELHYNTWITERTIERLKGYAGGDQPFLLWASYFDPHPPYIAPEPWDRMYDPSRVTVPRVTPGEHAKNPPHFQMTQEPSPDFSAWEEPEGRAMHGFGSHLQDRDSLAKDIATYYGMISLMDKGVGRILEALEANGQADNTLIVFTSDHGHFFGHHGLNAKGAFHYEDLVRVPFLVSWPGHVPAGRESDALQSLVDLPTSFLALAGIEKPRTMVGLDQSPVWLGQTESVRDHAIVENRHQPTTIHVKTYIDARHKLTVYYNRDYGELFDLQNDPGEIHNLWDEPESRELKAELTRKLLFAEMGKEPLWMPRIWHA
ncbi:MAG: sulfatase-like hydrolase/transferase [Opitutaceae bacterium]